MHGREPDADGGAHHRGDEPTDEALLEAGRKVETNQSRNNSS